MEQVRIRILDEPSRKLKAKFYREGELLLSDETCCDLARAMIPGFTMIGWMREFEIMGSWMGVLDKDRQLK